MGFESDAINKSRCKRFILKIHMMKKIIYLVSITWIMLLYSCSDVLDITPTDRYPDPAVWQDENLLKMFVNEQYSGICTKDNY